MIRGKRSIKSPTGIPSYAQLNMKESGQDLLLAMEKSLDENYLETAAAYFMDGDVEINGFDSICLGDRASLL